MDRKIPQRRFVYAVEEAMQRVGVTEEEAGRGEMADDLMIEQLKLILHKNCAKCNTSTKFGTIVPKSSDNSAR